MDLVLVCAAEHLHEGHATLTLVGLDALEVGVEEGFHHRFVAGLAGGAAHDGRAQQPGDEGVPQGDLCHRGLELGDDRAARVGGGLAADVLDGIGAGVLDATFRGEAEEHLHLAQLEALETARRGELVAELEEVLRGERLHHRELVDAKAEDGVHPPEVVHHEGHALLGKMRRGEVIAREPELREDQLEPELVGLVDDDEVQLVGGGAAIQATLTVEELGEVQVVPVGRCGHGPG
jgi:hypothetical protein